MGSSGSYKVSYKLSCSAGIATILGVMLFVFLPSFIYLYFCIGKDVVFDLIALSISALLAHSQIAVNCMQLKSVRKLVSWIEDPLSAATSKVVDVGQFSGTLFFIGMELVLLESLFNVAINFFN